MFFLTGVLAAIGFISYRNTPIETFPDVTNTQIIIIAQWPGRSAEEVEKFVSIPLETAFNSVQSKTSLRSTASFGLCYIRIIFDDNVDDAFARQQVLSRLQNADLPDGVMVARGGTAFLKWDGAVRLWSLAGYGPPADLAPDEAVRVLTPRPIVEAIRAGYRPDVHPSIGD